MAVYDITGNGLLTIYNKAGTSLVNAYDVNGEVAYGGTPLKVMTFNVQSFSGMNSQEAMLTDIFDTYNADIIGFQEIVSGYNAMPTAAKNALSNYENRAFTNHYNYNAIFSKSLTLQDVDVADYTSQDAAEVASWNETRSYIKCYIQKGGKRICIINTHLCVTTPASRYAQCAELFDMAEEEEYCVIIGDLNHYSADTSSNDWQNMYKQFVDSGYNLANCADDNSFVWTYSNKTSATGLDDTTAFYAPNCPDNIITSGNIDIASVTFDEIKLDYLNGSVIDHIPVVANLIIN